MQLLETWEEFAVAVAAYGPLVPVSTAARFHGLSDQALRDRIARGTLRTWGVNGALYVSLLSARRGGCPLLTGQVANGGARC